MIGTERPPRRDPLGRWGLAIALGALFPIDARLVRLERGLDERH